MNATTLRCTALRFVGGWLLHLHAYICTKHLECLTRLQYRILCLEEKTIGFNLDMQWCAGAADSNNMHAQSYLRSTCAVITCAVAGKERARPRGDGQAAEYLRNVLHGTTVRLSPVVSRDF